AGRSFRRHGPRLGRLFLHARHHRRRCAQARHGDLTACSELRRISWGERNLVGVSIASQRAGDVFAANRAVGRLAFSVQSVAGAASVAPGAELAWLPQETILFDRARLRRTIDVALAGDARLLLLEAVVFGRSGMGETVAEGLFADRWRIRRDGALIYAESIR